MIRLLLIFLFFINVKLSGQTDSLLTSDSLAKNKARDKAIYGNARKAAVMSAIIPGLGQAYNRKYWKVPVIYAGLGGLAYIFKTNHDQFRYYRDNLRAAADEDSLTLNISSLSQQQLQAQKLYYKRFRDFAAMGIGILYLLNIVDANVDAHLKTFDVSDDLSIRVRPDFIPATAGRTAYTGICIKLNFK